MIRTGYSFNRAYGPIDEVIKRLQAIEWTTFPITDTCSTFAFVEMTKAAKAAGLRPIYGVELPVVSEFGLQRPPIDYWRFLAIDSLRPLHDLIGEASDSPDHLTTLRYAQAMAAPGLIKISGNHCLINHITPQDDLFIGHTPSLPKGLLTEAQRRGFQFIAAPDNFYPCAADKELYRLQLGRRSATQTWPMHIVSDAEWPVDTTTRTAVLAACHAELINASVLVPEKTKTLHELCLEGAVKLNINLANRVYSERLNKELDLIATKRFEDYFYILADMINWAKERMIVGPARGSSCGSLVCYLLGITAIDPIPFGLLFERFIDVNRSDLPDVDVDFSDQRRHYVFEYAEQKYGKGRVARLGSVGTFQPKHILIAAGAALNIPSWQREKVAEGLIERSGGDSRANLKLIDTLTTTEAGRNLLANFPAVELAARLEGHPSNASQHAAGIVITNEPVVNYVAVNRRTNAAMCDKYDAEALNLLKIDALGLKQLSIFERVLELIGKPSKSGYLESLPLDDEAAFEVLNTGKFAGVFQFNGGALRSLTRQIKICHVNDMIAITALARPGPMATGGANSWVKRRNGVEPINYITPMMEELTKESYGIVVYQETVMRIVNEIGKFNWQDTSAIRKAMSGRLGNEFFESYGRKFMAGAAENGVDAATADAIWKQINTMGSWAFNKSHAVAYGILSYWSCYLKAHYPLPFAAATLDAEADPMRQIQLLRELKEEGIDYVAVDPERSTDRWAVSDNKLVGPLTAIKGIGPVKVKTIMAHRNTGRELPPALKNLLSEAKTPIDTLYPVTDAVAKVDLVGRNIYSRPTPIIELQVNGSWQNDVMVFATVIKIAPKDENEAVNIVKRGGKRLIGPTAALNMFVRDDTDEIFCKVDRFLFEQIGRPIVERGRANKAVYAIKGTVPPGFRMIRVERVKYLCDLADDIHVNPRSTVQHTSVDP